LVLVGIGVVVIGLGAALTWWLRRIRYDAEGLVSTALHAAYLGNAVIYLLAFSHDPELGWWLTLVTSGVIVLHALWTVIASIRRTRMLLG
jgi:hypothetical protein